MIIIYYVLSVNADICFEGDSEPPKPFSDLSICSCGAKYETQNSYILFFAKKGVDIRKIMCIIVNVLSESNICARFV